MWSIPSLVWLEYGVWVVSAHAAKRCVVQAESVVLSAANPAANATVRSRGIALAAAVPTAVAIAKKNRNNLILRRKLEACAVFL